MRASAPALRPAPSPPPPLFLTWHVAPSSEMSRPSSFSRQWRGAVAPASPSVGGGHSSAELCCTESTRLLMRAARVKAGGEAALGQGSFGAAGSGTLGQRA